MKKHQLILKIFLITLFSTLPFSVAGASAISEMGGIEFVQAKANLLSSQKNFAEALNLWKQVLERDPSNKSALENIAKLNELILIENKTTLSPEEKRGILSMREANLGDSISQYSHTQLSKTDIAQQYDERFDHSIALVYNDQYHNYTTVDERETFDLQENIRFKKSTKNASLEVIASHEYENADTREDYRLRHATAVITYKDYLRIVVGDTSTYFSRFVLNGMNFRGLDINLKYPLNLSYGNYNDFYGETKIIAGVIPYFDTDAEDYIYPYNLFGLKQKIHFTNWYQCGFSFSVQDHGAKVTRIDSEYLPKRNTLISFDQHFNPIPTWSLDHESAMSWTDDNTQVDRKLSPTKVDSAHYFESNIKTKKIRLFNRYEYSGKNFRSYLGTPRFLQNRILTDAEIMTNFFSIEPVDNLIFESQLNRYRNNLGHATDLETSKNLYFKNGVKILSDDRTSSLALRTSYGWLRNIPGVEPSLPAERILRDYTIEWYKKVLDFDYRINYTRQRTFEDYDIYFYPTYKDELTLSATTPFVWKSMIINYMYRTAYSQMRKNNDWTKFYLDHEFNVNISSSLLKIFNASLGYNRLYRDSGEEDEQPSLDDHAIATTISCPITKNFKDGTMLTISPVFAVKYHNDNEVTDRSNYNLSFHLDANYYMKYDQRVSVTMEYNDHVDHSSLGYGDEEFRVWVVYKHSFGV